MSEIIDNSRKKRELLKELILRLHRGDDVDEVKTELKKVLGEIPYDDVVAVEQELIAEGLPQEEVVKLCDVHTAVLEGRIDQSGAQKAPPGHPVHTFQQENKALASEISAVDLSLTNVKKKGKHLSETDYYDLISRIHTLMDVDKHYRRKENLLFPFLEKHGITGPPGVMWAKHDETRDLIKKAAAFSKGGYGKKIDINEITSAVRKISDSILEMINKEENILFPMCLDTLTDDEWYEIYKQSPEIGFTIVDPAEPWRSELKQEDVSGEVHEEGRIIMPSGSLALNELTSLLNTLPVDITFVDKDDIVRYFSQGSERIFDRNRAVIGRKVQQCHPPSSVSTVEKILSDFHSGSQDSTAFWINLKGKFIHIEYFAVRDEDGRYLGTLEVTQDLTEKRKLEGEQRLLSYK